MGMHVRLRQLSFLLALLLSAPAHGSAASHAAECPKRVVLMGYWPPTNEMLRQWSTSPAQNPAGWQGADWRGSGFDVYAFFPEFPPDGDPSNDPIGSVGSVGSAESDLRVDYQDTTADFWRIVDTYQPQILITTSRGGSIGWEIEAVEGGHGSGEGDASADWASDRHGSVLYPTRASVEPRSWAAISRYRQGNRLDSQLPMAEIAEAASRLELTSVQIDPNTSGNYLSGFMGLHGLYYNLIAPHNVTAGHIHVGRAVPASDAVRLMETTLEVVLRKFPAETLGCPES